MTAINAAEIRVTQTSSTRLGSHRVQRILEVLPGSLTWFAVTSPIWAALLVPASFSTFLTFFGFYWSWQSISFIVFLGIGFYRLQRDQRRDWQSDVNRFLGNTMVHHLVIIPTYGEDEEILADTLRC